MYSLSNLERTIFQQQKTELERVSEQIKGYPLSQTPLSLHRTKHTSVFRELSKTLEKDLVKTFTLTFRAAPVPDDLSPELLRKVKKKRKGHRIR
jgi:hypothetical protein